MYPEARAEAASADPDRRLCRSRAEARSGRGRRLAHLFLPPRELRQVLGEGPQLRQGGRQGSGHADERRTAADHDRQIARRGRRPDDGMARQGMGLRVVERLDQGQRDHGHGGRMRGAAQGAPRRRRAEAHLRPLQVRDGPDRDHRATRSFRSSRRFVLNAALVQGCVRRRLHASPRKRFSRASPSACQSPVRTSLRPRSPF